VVVQDKCDKCKAKLKTNLQFNIFIKTNYSCFPHVAGMEDKVKLGKGTKISMEDESVPVHSIYKEQLSAI
jgi:hypothetical protein